MMIEFAAILDGNNIVVGFTSADEVEAFGEGRDEYQGWGQVSRKEEWVDIVIGDQPGEFSPDGAVDLLVEHKPEELPDES